MTALGNTVTLAQVKQILTGSESGDKDLGFLCQNNNINMWSRRKPVNVSKSTELQESDYAGANYGINISSFESNFEKIPKNNIWGSFPCTYKNYPIGNTCPFRLTDFKYYDHAAKGLFYPAVDVNTNREKWCDADLTGNPKLNNNDYNLMEGHDVQWTVIPISEEYGEYTNTIYQAKDLQNFIQLEVMMKNISDPSESSPLSLNEIFTDGSSPYASLSTWELGVLIELGSNTVLYKTYFTMQDLLSETTEDYWSYIQISEAEQQTPVQKNIAIKASNSLTIYIYPFILAGVKHWSGGVFCPSSSATNYLSGLENQSTIKMRLCFFAGGRMRTDWSGDVPLDYWVERIIPTAGINETPVLYSCEFFTNQNIKTTIKYNKTNYVPQPASQKESFPKTAASRTCSNTYGCPSARLEQIQIYDPSTSSYVSQPYINITDCLQSFGNTRIYNTYTYLLAHLQKVNSLPSTSPLYQYLPYWHYWIDPNAQTYKQSESDTRFTNMHERYLITAYIWVERSAQDEKDMLYVRSGSSTPINVGLSPRGTGEINIESYVSEGALSVNINDDPDDWYFNFDGVNFRKEVAWIDGKGNNIGYNSQSIRQPRIINLGKYVKMDVPLGTAFNSSGTQVHGDYRPNVNTSWRVGGASSSETFKVYVKQSVIDDFDGYVILQMRCIDTTVPAITKRIKFSDIYRYYKNLGNLLTKVESGQVVPSLTLYQRDYDLTPSSSAIPYATTYLPTGEQQGGSTTTEYRVSTQVFEPSDIGCSVGDTISISALPVDMAIKHSKGSSLNALTDITYPYMEEGFANTPSNEILIDGNRSSVDVSTHRGSIITLGAYNVLTFLRYKGEIEYYTGYKEKTLVADVTEQIKNWDIQLIKITV